MVLMKYFCFCVPVRLGVIITSAMTIIENAVVLIGLMFYNAKDIVDKTNTLVTKENSYDSSSKELYEIAIENVRKCKSLKKIEHD